MSESDTPIYRDPKVCIGCHQPIAKPTDAQWDLARAGIPVHDNPTCLDLAEDVLAKEDEAHPTW